MAKTKAKQTTEKKISQGMCIFCQNEFAKNKMTLHLKNCKARAASVAHGHGETRHLFHLLVEGVYRPGYWMHLEVPADATLYALDGFLRAIWLECCGHMSEFNVGNRSYVSSPEENWGDVLLDPAGEVDQDTDQSEEEESDEQLPSLEDMSAQISASLASEFHANLKDVPLAEIEEKLAKQLSENLPSGLAPLASPEFRPFLSYMAAALQQGTLASELLALEEDDGGEENMDVELGKILTVGKKFSYVYDFGSSTNLALRVISERDGTLPLQQTDEDDEESLLVMARNEQPEQKCHICNRPAVHILPEWEYNYLDEAGLCDACAKKRGSIDELLPIVNSPRMGVCAYTGEADYEEEWDEDDDGDDEE